MNKLYVPALALALVGGSASAQVARQGDQGLAAKKFRHASVREGHRPAQGGVDREIIWSDDFSNAANWVLGTITGADADSWVIGTDGPSGAFAIDPLESTTAANGFAMFDSDLLCSGNQQAFVRMADPVDLSAYGGVVLQFEQLFRRFRGDCFVDVSTDGTNWTETEVNADIAVNDDTGNPDLEQVNLSALAGGEPQVWVRFRYYSTVEVHGAGGGCDYAWMVDDVAFVTLPDFEVEMQYGYVSTTGTGEEYGRIPQAQLPGTLNVGAGVFNFGGQDQTNIVVTSTFTGPTAITEVVSTTIASLASQEDTATDDNVNIVALGLGEYTVNHTMTSDQIASDEDPDNNTAVRNFEVTSDLYSLDKIGGHATGVTQVLQQVGTASFTDNSQDVKLMTMYMVNTQMTVYGMQVAISVNSRAGGTISAFVLDTADVLATPSVVNLPVDGIESDVYTIDAGDVTRGFVNLEFPQPLTLAPGAYYACVNLGGSGTTAVTTDAEIYVLDDITIAQPGLAAALYIAVDFNEDGTEGPHFYGGNGTAWAIRMSSNPNIGVEENEELAGISVFPNPSNGLITVSTATTGLHTVEVTNVLGELVLTTTINGTTAMDLSGLNDGVYSIRVAQAGRTKVERIVLN